MSIGVPCMNSTRVDKAYKDEYEIEEDLRALARASAVKKDPERMKCVKAMAKKKLEEYKRQEDEKKALVALGEGKDII